MRHDPHAPIPQSPEHRIGHLVEPKLALNGLVEEHVQGTRDPQFRETLGANAIGLSLIDKCGLSVRDRIRNRGGLAPLYASVIPSRLKEPSSARLFFLRGRV